MSNILKRMLGVVLSLMMVFSLAIPALANEVVTDEEYQEYLGYVNQGILGKDVSFQDWKDLKNEAAELEAILEAENDFSMVFDSASPNASYTMKAGDIFVTNGTSSAGITGHAGIAISSSRILHIAGFGSTPTTISLSTWNSNYTNATDSSWTKVYRHSSTTTASAAAKWAADTYEGSSAGYSITQDLTTTYETYCSKIVWQAYYYGPSSPAAAYIAQGYVLPYQLSGLIYNVSLKVTLS